MTNKQEQTSREAFEDEYCKARSGHDVTKLKKQGRQKIYDYYCGRKGNGQYTYSGTREAWKLWQAATRWADR